MSYFLEFHKMEGDGAVQILYSRELEGVNNLADAIPHLNGYQTDEDGLIYLFRCVAGVKNFVMCKSVEFVIQPIDFQVHQ
jgi:hypothetical protein